MPHLLDWLGTALLLLAGTSWGARVARDGVTGGFLLLTAALTGTGLTLTARAFLRGHDLPLVLGVTGALVAATLMIFTRRGD